MLTQKQKDLRDKKVEEISTKVAEKQAQIDRNITQHNELMLKLQEEKEEMELFKKALEDVK